MVGGRGQHQGHSARLCGYSMTVRENEKIHRSREEISICVYWCVLNCCLFSMNAFLFHGTWPAKKPWLDGVHDSITGQPRPERGNVTWSRIKDSHKMHKTLIFWTERTVRWWRLNPFCCCFCFFKSSFDQSPQTPSCVSSVCHLQKTQKKTFVKKFIISSVSQQNTSFLTCFIKVVGIV